MKIQKSVATSVTIFFAAQVLFAPFGSFADPGADSSGQFNATVPGFYGNFQTPVYSQDDISFQLNQCLTLHGLMGAFGSLVESATGITSSVKKAEDLDEANKKKYKYDRNDQCSKSCEKPNLPETAACTDYAGPIIPGKPGETPDRRNAKPNAQKTLDEQLKKIDDYVSCLDAKSNCEDSNKTLLQNQMKAFDCQKQVLLTAIQKASGQLGQAVSANKKTYNDMNLLQSEVAEQMAQVDSILGPDPELGQSGSGEMQGLLGLQKSLYEKLPEMASFELTTKTSVEKLKNQEKAVEQNLEYGRIREAANCLNTADYLSNSDGSTAVCNFPAQQMDANGKPTIVTDRNGNPVTDVGGCSPLAYMRGKITQGAFITANGQYLMKGKNVDASKKNVASFNALWSDMMRAMGYRYKADSSGNPTLDTSFIPDSTLQDWQAFEKKFGSKAGNLSRKVGFDILGELRRSGSKCFDTAKTWKQNQVSNQSSEYNAQKIQISENRNELISKIDTNLGFLKKSYSDMVSVLKPEGSNSSGTIDTTQCTKTDPEKMQDCFRQIRQQVSNMMEGTGMSFTVKTITKGTMTPAISLPCKGLNGCVTKLKDTRRQMKTYNAHLQKIKISKVNENNSAIDQGVRNLSSKLSGYQNGLIAIFDQMKQTVTKMGATVPENASKLEYLEKEALKPMQTEDKTVGPFEAPSDFGKALSQNMEPGLINLNSSPTQSLMDAANTKITEKKADLKEKLEVARNMRSTYAKVGDECSIDFRGNAVGSSHSSCSDCTRLKQSCTDSKDQRILNGNSSLDELLRVASTIRVGVPPTSTELQNAYTSYDNVLSRSLTTDCKTELQKCDVCLEEGKQQIYNNNANSNNNANAASQPSPNP